jgi:hypothetical protein
MSNSITSLDLPSQGRDNGTYRAFSEAAVASAKPAGGNAPAFATALRGARGQSWDPHDVWLNRVKKPRDAQPR